MIKFITILNCNDYIDISDIGDIVNYFNLSQPGFEISYRNQMEERSILFDRK